MGISKVISTSKIKKINAIKKKCSENGSRDKDLGSNPHSKADTISRENNIFSPIKVFNIINTKEITILTININNNITFIPFENFLIGN